MHNHIYILHIVRRGFWVKSCQGANWGFSTLLKGTSVVFRRWSKTSPTNLGSILSVHSRSWTICPLFPKPSHHSCSYVLHHKFPVPYAYHCITKPPATTRETLTIQTFASVHHHSLFQPVTTVWVCHLGLRPKVTTQTWIESNSHDDVFKWLSWFKNNSAIGCGVFFFKWYFPPTSFIALIMMQKVSMENLLSFAAVH